ncbi:MAG: GNAT family N-acetyltransferase [Fibrobacter sp.]|nr:GNAT family N-acetyltransferase [Fibrobacter sp.]
MSDLKSDICSDSPVCDSQWLDYCKGCSYATFFQTPMWVRAFEQWSEGRIKADVRIFEFSDGKKVLFPLAVKKIGWLRIGISMPASTYGGWITMEKLQPEHAHSLLKYIRRKYKDLILQENPYDPLISDIPIDKARNVGTSSIDLSQGIESVIKNSKYYHRKNLKTAEKSGVTIQLAEDFSKWLEYYDVYKESIDRWKDRKIFSGVKYDLRLFEILHQLDPSLRKLWIADLGGKVIAGILCFYWNKHAVAWNGAGLSGYFHCRPNNMLYQCAIEHACKNNYHWFDCNPSGGLEGVSNFKQGLGAKMLQARIIDQRSFTRKIVALARFQK